MVIYYEKETGCMYIMRDDGNVGVDLWYWQCICGGESGNTGNFRTGGRADSESVEGIHFCERCRKCSGIFRKASEKDQWLYKRYDSGSRRISSAGILQKRG